MARPAKSRTVTMPSSKDTTNTTGGSRRNSAVLGNFANDEVDRSVETVMTRKQKRQQRRQTLRMQSEIAPFMGMDLGGDDEVHKDMEKEKNDEKKEADEQKAAKDEAEKR
ncbi:hypothetical protein IL306_008344 [Fusarium sp. DS 682]|nr:hypothetical protein IL306_008344 [Fusarium sp. DS 682]